MKLKTVIPFLDENMKDIKIHFARGRVVKEEALKAFLAGGFKSWQEHQTKRNFERKYILSLILLDDGEWLFAGVYKRQGVSEIESDNHYRYKTSLTDIGSDLIGKVVVRFKRTFRQSYCLLENYIDDLEVLEIKRDMYSIPFPGYDKVSISWQELYVVINTDAWKTALQNQKGVYLLTDVSCGKMYVGSAIGEEMIWSRWKTYVDNGHGGNKDLKRLSFKHIKENFIYTILDVYKANTDDDVILEREQWWKNVLKTREYGYNRN